MTLNFGKSQSTQMPLLLDTESSQTSVYIRRNVQEKQVQDEMGGEPRTVYEYEECVLTKQEYLQYRNEQLQAENDALKAQVAEQADAMIELAGMVDALNTKSNEQADALIELAGMVG